MLYVLGKVINILSDIEIAQSANLKPIVEIAKGLGLSEEDIESYGDYKAKIKLEVLDRLKDKPDGKLILVSTVIPTRSGEGKTTMAIGLGQALGKLGVKNLVVLRQPSLGPVFGIKGGACGGGYAQVLPMEDINIHFTGDLHAITVAHDLLTSMLENHIYRDNKLSIDPHEILWKRVLDIESRDLRHIVLGLGGKQGGTPHEGGFEITAASEIASIHSLAQNLMDLKQKMAEITVAYNRDDEPVKCGQLKAEGAMTILMKDAVEPNLVQTLENTPAIIHGVPFANIAHGCPSLIAIKMALKLADYVIVEPGFGADLGIEKFCDIAARAGGLKPDLVVLVVTMKALKHHGGAKPREIDEPNVKAVEKGLVILNKEIENAAAFGLPAVICINHFQSDLKEEINVVSDWCRKKGVPVALSDTFMKGGEGGLELAKLMLNELATGKPDFRFLYPLEMSIEEKIRTIAKTMYGVQDIAFLPDAKTALRKIEKLGFEEMPICMAKTELSLTDNENIRGLPPKGYVLPVTNLKPCTGAGFIVAYCGDVNTMPALPSHPAAEKMDIDEKGRITGLS
jgi:formate--tetrahydrofolate ligase